MTAYIVFGLVLVGFIAFRIYKGRGKTSIGAPEEKEYGAELVYNGGFDKPNSASVWDWPYDLEQEAQQLKLSISGGGGGYAAYIGNNKPFVAGKNYRVEFEIVDTNTTNAVSFGGVTLFGGIGEGMYAMDVEADTDETIRFSFSGASVFTILDNISIREVL